MPVYAYALSGILLERWLGPVDLDTLLALTSENYQCLQGFNRRAAILVGDDANLILVDTCHIFWLKLYVKL